MSEKETGMQTLNAEKQKQLISVLKKTIFKSADDAELALYIHKCQQVGVNPLDKAIIPIKFKDNKDGGYVVNFIATIDLYRSLAEDTGLYEGSDEPTYEGELDLEYTEDVWENGRVVDTLKKTMKVPEICRVNIWKKGITRATVGVARWKEYYPGQKKGEKWRQMPTTMLSKCAEANGLRKAFPKKLNKLYTEEEMQLTTAALSGVGGVKTSITAPAATGETVNDDEFQAPADSTRLANNWISDAQETRLYTIATKSKVSPGNVLNWLRIYKNNSKLHICHISRAKKSKTDMSEYDKIIETIQKTPEFFKDYGTASKKPQEASQQAPGATSTAGADKGYTPTPREEFEATVRDLMESAQAGTERLDAELKALEFPALSEVPEAEFKNVVKHLSEVL